MVTEEFQRFTNQKCIEALRKPTIESVDTLISVAQQAYTDFKDLPAALKVTNFLKHNLCLKLNKVKDYEELMEFSDYVLMRDINLEEMNAFWRVMLFEVPYSLESFIIYMEHKREPKKRFYQPRQKQLKVVVDDLQALEERKYDFYGLSLPARTGKLIADNIPVLTKDGWKKHGDLKIGDYVVGRNGEWVKVQYVHPKNYANKRVWFTDYTYIDCHEKHEWILYDRSQHKEVVVETSELENCNGDTRSRFQLPILPPICGSKQDLFVDPYVLGVWLGDETINKPAIPEQYLISDISQRLELLAGLLDTNGTLRTHENRYSYSTTSERLKDDVISLISSLGWRTSVVKYKARKTTSGIEGKHDVYRIDFNPTFAIPCRVNRKQLKHFSKQRKIGIKKVENIKPISGNCITVEGGIYRVGKTLKPTHNSTICIFFLTWIALKRPNSHNAMGGHSGILAKGFYKELLNFITSPEYTYGEMFEYVHPKHTLLRDKSADDFTILLDEPDRFATLTCRGIDGTWTGAIDISADGYLYVDDLVRDREHSLSPSRMENTYQEYLNKMVDRKNDGARELMVGTLWNVLDPLERLRVQYENNPHYKFRKIPALNEYDESNFDYKINGFSTSYYHEMRERLDKAEWMAKFMQSPFVREGLLFPVDELRFFNGILPEGDSRVVAVVDVAWGGGDSLSMPIGRQYDNGDIYIFAWVFNKGPKEVTLPLVTGQIINNEIREIRFEGNTGGDLYAKYVDEMLQKAGWKCSCTSRKAPNNMEKMSKIIAYSGDIKRKFIFLSPQKLTAEEKEKDAQNGIIRYERDKEYNDAMNELEQFVVIGKNDHDDAGDSLSQLEMFLENPSNRKIAVLIDSPI